MWSGIPALDSIGFAYPNHGIFLVSGQVRSGKSQLLRMMRDQFLDHHGPVSCRLSEGEGLESLWNLLSLPRGPSLVLIDDFHYVGGAFDLYSALHHNAQAGAFLSIGLTLQTCRRASGPLEVTAGCEDLKLFASTILSLEKSTDQGMAVKMLKNRDGLAGPGLVARVPYSRAPSYDFWTLLDSETF